MPPAPIPRNIVMSQHTLGWLYGTHIAQIFTVLAVLIGLGHSVLAMSGAESLAQVYREIEHPEIAEPEKSSVDDFYLQHGVHVAGFLLCGDDHSGSHPASVFREPDWRTGDEPDGPFVARLAFHIFVVVVGTLILSGAVNTAIVGSNGVLNRVSEDGVLSAWFRQPHPKHSAPRTGSSTSSWGCRL